VRKKQGEERSLQVKHLAMSQAYHSCLSHHQRRVRGKEKEVGRGGFNWVNVGAPNISALPLLPFQRLWWRAERKEGKKREKERGRGDGQIPQQPFSNRGSVNACREKRGAVEGGGGRSPQARWVVSDVTAVEVKSVV